MIKQMMIFGIIISMAFYELTGISPGGLIVPGYISVFLNDPKRILITIAVAGITALLVKVLSRYMIIYGRRRFYLCIILSFAARFAFDCIKIKYFQESGSMYLADAIGTIIPGILANEYLKSGFIDVTASLVVVSIFIKSAWTILNSVVKFL